jgi:uncharacterized protein
LGNFVSQHLLKLIQQGATAELASIIEETPALAAWRDAQGVSALLWSVYLNQSVIRDFLVSQLTDIDIFEASAVGDVSRIEGHLIADPAAANLFSADGWTPLHLAAAFATPEAVRTLLEHGAKVNQISKNAQRNAALHACLALSKNSAIVELLLTRGADPELQQAGGFTPLIQAAVANRRDLVDLLLSHGASPHNACDWKKTPSVYARERGHLQLAEYLDSLNN